MKAAFFNEPVAWLSRDPLDYVYGNERSRALADLAEFHSVVITGENFDREAPHLADLEVIFTTWKMPHLTAAQIARLPRLRAIFYAAGAVDYFARPYLERGVAVVCAKPTNAEPVAEYCLAQILLGMKGYFRNVREYRRPENFLSAFRGPGNYRETVAIIGVGQVGGRLVKLLRPFRHNIIVADQFLSESAAAELNVRKVSVEEAFATAFVVSNHLADLPATKAVFTRSHFASMRPGAVFLNTGRGAQVVESDLIAVLTARPDLTALLDVTDPEPAAAASALFRLPNVQLATHLAGALNGEVGRLADTVIEEFLAFRAGKPLRYAIPLAELAPS